MILARRCHHQHDLNLPLLQADSDKANAAQPWPASLTPVPELTPVDKNGIRNRQAKADFAPVLVGDTGTGQYCVVKDHARRKFKAVSCNELQKFRWNQAQFEVKEQHSQDAEPFLSPVFAVPEQTREYVVSFGTIGTKQNEAGKWHFSEPGTYLVRLHLGQVPYALNSLSAQATSLHHTIEATAATICSDWYEVEVVEPSLGQADSCVLLTPLSQVQRRVPMDLDVGFKKGCQAVQLTAADVQSLSLEDASEMTNSR